MKLILKTLKAIIMVTAISYFFAMAFKMLCDIQADYYSWDGYVDSSSDGTMTGEGARDHFTVVFNMQEKEISDTDSILKFVYFSFTTLTTVGFGDVVPTKNVAKW